MMYTIKVWLLAALTVGAAVLGAAGAWTVKSYQCSADVARAKIDVAEMRTKIAEERLNNEYAVRAMRDEADLIVQRVSREYNEREKKLRASVAGARRELEQLRDESKIPIPAAPFADNPTPPAGADDLTVTRHVLGECAAALSTVAEAADAAEAKLIGLQEYVAKTLGVFSAQPSAGKL